MSENLGLGKIITTEQHRDAIHIAVVPVVAGQTLSPGTKVRLSPTGEAILSGRKEPIGIVDPFLDRIVAAGEKFWLFLNPGSITSLRHDWTHPAFQDELSERDMETVRKVTGKLTSPESELWLREFAAQINFGYEEFMEELAHAIKTGDSIHTGDQEIDVPDELWTHYEAVTGKTVPEKDRENLYFSCAC